VNESCAKVDAAIITMTAGIAALNGVHLFLVMSVALRLTSPSQERANSPISLTRVGN
jgi:hypothetical protein